MYYLFNISFYCIYLWVIYFIFFSHFFFNYSLAKNILARVHHVTSTLVAQPSIDPDLFFESLQHPPHQSASSRQWGTHALRIKQPSHETIIQMLTFLHFIKKLWLVWPNVAALEYRQQNGQSTGFTFLFSSSFFYLDGLFDCLRENCRSSIISYCCYFPYTCF